MSHDPQNPELLLTHYAAICLGSMVSGLGFRVSATRFRTSGQLGIAGAFNRFSAVLLVTDSTLPSHTPEI